jgi:BON domain
MRDHDNPRYGRERRGERDDFRREGNWGEQQSAGWNERQGGGRQGGEYQGGRYQVGGYEGGGSHGDLYQGGGSQGESRFGGYEQRRDEDEPGRRSGRSQYGQGPYGQGQYGQQGQLGQGRWDQAEQAGGERGDFGGSENRVMRFQRWNQSSADSGYRSGPGMGEYAFAGSNYGSPYSGTGSSTGQPRSHGQGNEQGYGQSIQGGQGYGQGGQGQGQRRGKAPKGYQRSDDRLKEMICEKLMDEPSIDASEVSIDVQGQVVTLEGTVESRQAKYEIESLIDQYGAKDIVNNIKVTKNQQGQGQEARGANRSQEEGQGNLGKDGQGQQGKDGKSRQGTQSSASKY